MAYSDVNKFLAGFDGGARPNRYMVQLTKAPFVALDIPENFKFLCRSSSIPSSIVSPCPVNYMGREIKVPGDRTFDDWSVTVYNTKDWKIRSYFEKWSNGLSDNFHNYDWSESYDESGWSSEALVWQLDRHENVIARYKVAGIFPNSVSDIPLAWDSNNTVEEFTVTFSVHYWISRSTSEDSPIPESVVSVPFT